MTAISNVSDADPWKDFNCNDAELQNLLDQPLEGSNNSGLRENPQHFGFDSSLADSWIYPSNLPCRSYQLSIVQAALYKNTLVVLPTGLGKTFIAAVIMYNIFRWYPNGKVLFMAPTRPLVNQQIEACQKIMPFPRKATVELTGKIPRSKRTDLWKSKRVFFATPHVVQSDIIGGGRGQGDNEEDLPFDISIETNKTESEFPFESIKLIVIDEAHKAKGKYAFTEVTQALAARTKYFRVLALSATPGRTMDDVAEVCRNLMISHIEVRWDNSIDVMPFVHKRHMETVVVTLGDRIKDIKEKLLQIIDPYMRQLCECNVLSGSLANVNRNFLVFQQKSFQERSMHNGRHPQHSTVVSNFGICISLYHALELLERHGTRVFLNYFEDDQDGKAKYVIQMERRLRSLVDGLNQEVGPNPFDISAGPMTNGQVAEMPKDLDFGHPKFEKARECLLKHFEINGESRAIVFCEYRESVLLIYRMLLQHVPLLRPRCFVGQGGTGSLRALTQKQQIQIMNDFRSGKSNILIATSIGEEGIDVGEVDLIVCFDISTSNPTRFVQRIGRTGRQKNGNVVMLVTEGKEQQILKDVLSNKDQINKKLLRSSVVQQALYKHSPRLVPTEFKPKCIQTLITPDEEEEEKPKKSLAKNVTKTKPSEKGVQDLRKFFNKKPLLNMDAEDMKYFEIDTKLTQAKPGMLTQQKMEKSFESMKNLFKDMQRPEPTQINNKMKIVKQNLSKEDSKLSEATIEVSDDSFELNVDPEINDCKISSSNQGSIKNFFKDTNVIHNKINKISPPANVTKNDTLPPTHSNVNKGAKINVISHHLLCKEISDDSAELKVDTETNDCKKSSSSQGSIKNFFKESHAIDNKITKIPPPSNVTKNDALSNLKLILEKPFTYTNVIKRAKINDMSYHLLSKEMSDDMKYILLCQKPQFIKDNLEQLNVLNALQEWDGTNETPEEKLIKEISKIIDKVFEGRENVEKFLQDYDLAKYKKDCLTYDESDEDCDPEHIQKFEKDLDKMFNDFKEPLKTSNTYEWIQKKFLDSERFKIYEKTKGNSIVQESMVYRTLAGNDDCHETNDDCHETEIDICPDTSIMDSKDCSQWLEFNKPDLKFKSTPLHGTINKCLNIRPSNLIKRSSLLTKLEEAKEEEENLEEANEDEVNGIETEKEELMDSSIISPQTEINQSLTNTSNKFLDSLKTCEESLHALLQQRKLEQTKDSKETLDGFFNADSSCSTDSNKTTGSLIAFESEQNLIKNRTNSGIVSKSNDIPNSNLPKISEGTEEDGELFLAAIEAEQKFSQSKTEEIKPKQEISPNDPPSSSLNSTPDIDESVLNQPIKEISIEHELDVDMEAFMEPFPEEQELMKFSNTKPLDERRESLKENFAKQACGSPDLFLEEHMPSPNLPNANKPLSNSPSAYKQLPAKRSTLSSKLSTKLTIPKCQSSINTISSFKSPRELLHSTKSLMHELSPSKRLSTNQLKSDKSPSLFDMYMKNTKGKGKIPRTLTSCSSTLGLSKMANSSSNLGLTKMAENTSPQVKSSQTESPIVMRRKNLLARKRKIFDSDSQESDNSCNDVTVLKKRIEKENDDSDFEEVAATQAPDDSRIYHHRRKRKRFNCFIVDEAAISGSDVSEDEEEHSIGGYLLDSMVVHDDENDEDQASTTHMQAMYLQSLKSPQNRRGAFKIPAPRVYNDHSRIFSQTLLPEDTYSQYVADSFIVEEDENGIKNNSSEKDVSMCPLERAEMILKERRKARKHARNSGQPIDEPRAIVRAASQLKRKRANFITSSSDEDFE